MIQGSEVDAHAASRGTIPPVTGRRRPSVTVSYAQTLDGRLATATGCSQWIGGPASLRLAHELRAAHDAIMVGVGTVCRDDPRLTVRLAAGADPLRVVVDSSLRTPPTSAVVAGTAAAGTLFAVAERALDERCAAFTALGATVLRLPPDNEGRVDLVALLAELHARGVGSVMVEGGARLITSLLRAHAVDRLVVCIAPKILGLGIEAVGDLGIRDLGRALVLENVQVTRYGADHVLDGRVSYPEAPDAR